MNIIENHVSNKFLEFIQDLKKSYKLYDMHAHPFELFYRKARYSPHPKCKSLFSTDDSTEFLTPTVDSFSASNQGKRKEVSNIFMRPEIIEKRLNRLYAHTGPKVFKAHMKLSGIDKVLLLPVAPAEGTLNKQMIEMEEMFGEDNKFCFGWSVPNSVTNDKIYISTKSIKKKYNIWAIKLHPNMTEIDITNNYGIERVESILESCNKLKLSLVVHGGRSPLLKNKESVSYSIIDNLCKINWGISNSPVVIAHAGSYGSDYNEAKNEIFPKLDRLLCQHDNLFIDLSGLDLEILQLALKKIDHDRILFGSDALYHCQWQEIVKILISMESTTKRVEEAFIKIICLNPMKTIFK